LINCGCEHWALLFDDIECEMSQEDQTRFASFAHAQVAVTNEIYDYLEKPNLLLFCPTGRYSLFARTIDFIDLFAEYCNRMARPSLETSSYLQTIGNGLHPDIDIFWTGTYDSLIGKR
jgi:protein O-GlcNAcase/histone acetyltransferase